MKAFNEQKVQGYECGADSYILKPFSAKLLQVRLRNLIAQPACPPVLELRQGKLHPSVLGRELECVRQQVIRYPLQLPGIGYHRISLIGRGSRHREMHMLAIGKRADSLGPLVHLPGEGELRKVHLQLAALELAEVEYLIDEAQQHRHVLMHDAKQETLVLVQVTARLQLVDGVGYQRERRAEVVRYVGEESQLGVRRLLQLSGKADELVALRLQLFLLLGQLHVQPVLCPKAPHGDKQGDAE